MTYTCPVCGYNELPHPPEDWMICPCCNTMFGYSDLNWGVNELRREWIANGARWGGEDVSQPECWSSISQLRNIGYIATDADKIAIASMREESICAPIVFSMQVELQRRVKVTRDQTDVDVIVQSDNPSRPVSIGTGNFELQYA